MRDHRLFEDITFCPPWCVTVAVSGTVVDSLVFEALLYTIFDMIIMTYHNKPLMIGRGNILGEVRLSSLGREMWCLPYL